MGSGCKETLESGIRRDSDIRKFCLVSGDIGSKVAWPVIGIYPNNRIFERLCNAHQADYQRVLCDAAVQRGVVVRFDSRVEALDEDGPSVTIRGGEVSKGNVIIGADGKSCPVA
jgi:flavin-dependent dehydrogenase